MDNIVINDIKKRTNKLNSKYNKDAIPPIQLFKMIEEIGLSRGYKDFDDSKVAELDRPNKTIYLTKDEKLFRLWGNFALAHELGHWFLDDKNYDYFDPSTLINPNCDVEDKAANYFAALLLLPDDLMKEWSWLKKETFASAFNVPLQVIEMRKKISI